MKYMQLHRQLVKHANAYSGEIQLPRPYVNILHNFTFCDGKYDCKRLDRNQEGRVQVQDLLLDNFYTTAPLPVALELFKERKMTQYLQDELNLLFEGGVSFGVFQGQNLAGAIVNLFVEKPSQPTEYVCAKDWLNQAAELAVSQSSHHPVYFWRNLQFLHLQHFIQHVISEHDAEFGLHICGGARSKEFRGKEKDSFLSSLFRNLCEQVWAQGGVLTTVATFPNMERAFPRDEQLILDTVNYKELELTINGRRVFKPLEDLGSIKYLALVK